MLIDGRMTQDRVPVAAYLPLPRSTRADKPPMAPSGLPIFATGEEVAHV
jgi:hypothetical protein